MNEQLQQIDRLLDLGRTTDARRVLGPLLGAHPGDPELQVLAARIELEDSRNDEARRHLRSALSVDPAHALGRYLLFVLEMDERHWPEAEQIIIALIREHPEHAPFMARYADLMMQTLQLDKARELVDEALRLDPECQSARLTGVMLATITGDRAHARHELSGLIADDPHGQRVVRMMIVSLVDQGRTRDALGLAQELLRTQPDDQDLVDLVVDLTARRHPLGWPLWPMQRFGWGGSAAIWIGGIFVMNALRRAERQTALIVFLVVWVGYVVYSWVFPALIRNWIARRGV